MQLAKMKKLIWQVARWAFKSLIFNVLKHSQRLIYLHRKNGAGIDTLSWLGTRTGCQGVVGPYPSAFLDKCCGQRTCGKVSSTANCWWAIGVNCFL